MSSENDTLSEQALAFGPFRLFRRAKLLTENGRPVRLGNRALEILITLVEHAGRVVSKSELMSRVWPTTVVEETSLRVNLHGLRKILGDGQQGERYIVNVAGRGYQFVGTVTTINAVPHRMPTRQRGNSPLPALPTRAVGRDQVIHDLVVQSSRRRLITILGPGGIGKSTVALAVAERLADDGDQSIFFVDFTGIEDPIMVPAAIAGALGLSLLTDDPIAGLISYLQDVRAVIVLDNCEHVIAKAAELTERILHSASLIRLMATSREPLMVDGEHIYRLAPLRCPPEVRGLTATAALSYSAVQLFVERAIGGEDGFELTEENAAAIAGICQKLDGLPLAIELVAARANLLNTTTLDSGFGSDPLLLTHTRRDSHSRHRSLQAAMDWSFQTLNPLEQMALRRLSVFRGAFTFKAAHAVLESEATERDVREALTSLVSKSLLMTDVGAATLRFRLLYTTRMYAADKLAITDERSATLRRHARYHRDLLEEALSEWDSLTSRDWHKQFGDVIEDVRAALEWAFSSAGDLEIGATLMAASIPYGFPLQPSAELKRRAATALQVMSEHDLAERPWAHRLHLTLAAFLYHTGASPDEALANVDRSVALSATMGTLRYRIEPMVSRVAHAILAADYVDAVRRASEVIEIARRAGDPMGQVQADRVAAQALHFMGDLRQSKRLAATVLSHSAEEFPLPYSFGDLYVDRRVSMRIILARCLWLQGYAVQANQIAAEAVELASSDNNANTIIQSLALAACPVALWRGDIERAGIYTERLVYEARRFSFERWLQLGRLFEAAIAYLSDPDGNSPSRVADPTRYSSLLHREHLGTINSEWVDAELIERANRGLSGWCAPELLRIQGLRTLQIDPESGQAILCKAIELARAQGALSWELRATTALAKYLLDRDQGQEARSILRTVYEKFTEGFDSADLERARALLDAPA